MDSVSPFAGCPYTESTTTWGPYSMCTNELCSSVSMEFQRAPNLGGRGPYKPREANTAEFRNTREILLGSPSYYAFKVLKYIS